MTTSKPTGHNVVIGYCHPAEVPAAFMNSLTNLVLQDTGNLNRGGLINVYSGPAVDVARNTIVYTFLNEFPKADWLLMLDCDMVFEPDLVHRLLAAADNKLPFVGGLCFGLQPGIGAFPTVYLYNGRTFIPDKDYKRNSLVRCDGTGAACTLVHRQVYEAVAKEFGFPDENGVLKHNRPWYEFYSHAGVQFGEDLGFCLRVRSLGFPIHVDTSIKLGHVKPGVVNEEQFLTEQEVRVQSNGNSAPKLIVPGSSN